MEMKRNHWMINKWSGVVYVWVNRKHWNTLQKRVLDITYITDYINTLLSFNLSYVRPSILTQIGRAPVWPLELCDKVSFVCFYQKYFKILKNKKCNVCLFIVSVKWHIEFMSHLKENEKDILASEFYFILFLIYLNLSSVSIMSTTKRNEYFWTLKKIYFKLEILRCSLFYTL